LIAGPIRTATSRERSKRAFTVYLAPYSDSLAKGWSGYCITVVISDSARNPATFRFANPGKW
jgi:hypothetical protein